MREGIGCRWWDAGEGNSEAERLKCGGWREGWIDDSMGKDN